MDDSTFDRLARRLEALASRRTALGALSGAGFVAALAGSRLDASAKRKKKKKKCKRESSAASCDGRCGSVKDNCKKSVECGSCAACQRCNDPSKTCEPDVDQLGDECGTNRVCLASGACAACGGIDEPCCSGDSCGLGAVCVAGTCEACGFVGGPCCATGSCVPFIGSGCFEGTCELCGAAGEQCCPGGICNLVGLFCNGATCQS